MKKVEPKKWKKTKRKKRKLKEEDFYLQITENGKTSYYTLITRDEHKRAYLWVPPELAKEIMESINAKNWNEVELFSYSVVEGEIKFKVRKKSAYVI